MSGRYSAFALVRQGFAGHKGWPQAWRKAKPKPTYDFVIIGGGGHGLATAYYLAKTRKRRHVCVIEKGWLGGGNTGGNTTIVRSNYFDPESVALYDLALRLYEGLSRELNFNVMLSQRGILNRAHTQAQLEMAARLTKNFGVRKAPKDRGSRQTSTPGARDCPPAADPQDRSYPSAVAVDPAAPPELHPSPIHPTQSAMSESQPKRNSQFLHALARE
jgi:glycine/D-amino acid oxidase-like deaminating enzyme